VTIVMHYHCTPKLDKIIKCTSLVSIGIHECDRIVQNMCQILGNWKQINEKWPNFAIETCHIRLGLALMGSTHSET
jgi:hypothetical protein